MAGDANRKRGFTLTEILVVMGIMVVIAMVGQSFLRSSLDHANVTAVADEIATALRYARDSSIGTSQYYRFSVDAYEDTIAVERLAYDSSVFDTTANMLMPAALALKIYEVVDHPFKRGFKYHVNFAKDPSWGGVDVVKAAFGSGAKEFIPAVLGLGGVVPKGGGSPGAQSVVFDEYGGASAIGAIVIGCGGDTVCVVVDTLSGRISIGDKTGK